MSNIIIILNSMESDTDICTEFHKKFPECINFDCYNCPLSKWGTYKTIDDLRYAEKFNSIYGD